MVDVPFLVLGTLTVLIAFTFTATARKGLSGAGSRVVAALARGDLAYSTGQVIMVDGGMSVQRL